MKIAWTRREYDEAYQSRSEAYRVASGRYRLTKQVRLSLLERRLPRIGSQATILDIGCGTCLYYPRLIEACGFSGYGTVIGLDFSSCALRIAADNGEGNEVAIGLVQSDVHDLPVSDRSADLVLALEILEHVSDDQKVASEIFRVLKPGGYVVTSVPNSRHFPLSPVWFEQQTRGQIKIDARAGHVRRYRSDEIAGLLKTNGLVVLKVLPYIHFISAYLKLLNDEYSLLPKIAAAAVYEKALFPTAVFVSMLESLWLTTIDRSYGLLVIAHKPTL